MFRDEIDCVFHRDDFFGCIGKGIGVVTDAVFSAIVIMVMVTTFFAPVALRWSMARADRKRLTPVA